MEKPNTPGLWWCNDCLWYIALCGQPVDLYAWPVLVSPSTLSALKLDDPDGTNNIRAALIMGNWHPCMLPGEEKPHAN